MARRWRARARVSTPAIAGIPVVAQQRRELADVVEDGRGRVRDDEARSHGRSDWSSSIEPAVVADQRIGHDDDLAGIRRVGADLLVAGLRGVHDEVAAGRHRRPERDPGEDGAVLEGEQGRAESPDAGVDDRARAGGCGGIGRSSAITTPSHRNATGPVGLGGRANRRSRPPFRPHRTGPPASQDRPSRMAEG